MSSSSTPPGGGIPAKNLVPTLIVDCPDCGRTIAYRNKCGKCGSAYWLPAGYVNRRALKNLYLDWRNRDGSFDELVEVMEAASTK